MSRYINWTADLTAGAMARAEQVNADFEDFNGALDAVETDVNTTIRLTGGSSQNGSTPAQTDFEVADTPAQRAGRVLGFDSNGVPITLAAAFNWRGTWATNTVYKANDITVGPGAVPSLYLCEVNHTSGASFTAGAPNWVLMVDLTELYQFIYQFKIIDATSSPYQASAGDDLMVDVSKGAVTILLPATPVISDQPVSIVHVNGDVTTNIITVKQNGNVIMGVAEDMTIDTTNAALQLAFSNATFGWRLIKGT